ncbi:murein biosynthesis integral membrane protein MurJ [Leucobacter chromiireducens]|uniref:murein biosynthesis integral membrane protein MurJ n=1 Tax=Leucobacter chromiireducens TaxID=283877 RepID=UPI000F62E712|nr:lipid II flippase MurJ [Leucobacter chromiireducens]
MGLLRASAVMATGTILSRVLGLAKVIVLAAAIGQTSSVSADAFANGNMLPNTIYTILLGGMLNAVLVPQIVRAARNPDGGAGYINKILTFVIVALTIITALAMLGAPLLVWLFQLSWPADQLALSAAFAYWCLPQILFYGIYTVMGEVLNARSVFGPYTWAPVLNNIISIAGIVLFMMWFGADPSGARAPGDWNGLAIAVLAGSATLGVVAQALILFASWRKAGLSYRPDFVWRGMGLGATAKIASWSLAMIAVIQIGGWVTSNVVGTASGQGPSSASLGNAWLVLMMPHSVLAVSLATAYFTRFAEAGRDGRMTDFRADFSASVRQVSLVMVFAAGAIFAAATFLSPLIERGSPLQVEQFALVLRTYVLCLAPFSFLFIVQRSFYALSDTRTPFIFTCVQQGLFIVLAIACLWVPADVRGAAVTLAYSIATFAQALVGTILLRRKIGRIDGQRVLGSLVRFTLAVIPAVLAGIGTSLALQSWVPGYSVWQSFGFAIVVGLAVGVVYLMALLAMRSPEVSEITGTLRRKLGRG